MSAIALSIIGAILGGVLIAYGVYAYRQDAGGEQENIEVKTEEQTPEEQDIWGWVCYDCGGHSHSNREYPKRDARENASEHERVNEGHRTMLVLASSVKEVIERRHEVYDVRNEDEDEDEDGGGDHETEPGEFECTNSGCDRVFELEKARDGHLAQCPHPDQETTGDEAIAEQEQEPEEAPEAAGLDEEAESVEEIEEEAADANWLTSGKGSQVKWPRRVPCPRCDFSTDHKPAYGRHANVVHGVEYQQLIDELRGDADAGESDEEREESETSSPDPPTSATENLHVLDDIDPSRSDLTRRKRALAAARQIGGEFTTGNIARKMNVTGQQASSALSKLKRDGKIRSLGYGKWTTQLEYSADLDGEEEGAEESEPMPGVEEWDDPQPCPEPGCGVKMTAKSALKRHARLKHNIDIDVGTEDPEILERDVIGAE